MTSDKPTEPQVLSYVTPPSRHSIGASSFAWIGAGVFFAIGHLTTEYTVGYILEFKLFILGKPSTPANMQHMYDDFLNDMIIECAWTVLAALLVFVIHVIRCFNARSNARRHAWLFAFAIGAGYCLTRWCVWWLFYRSHIEYSERLNFLVAMALATACGIVIAGRRKPPDLSQEGVDLAAAMN